MKRSIKKAMVILAIAIAFTAGCQLGHHTTAGKDYEAACLFKGILDNAMADDVFPAPFSTQIKEIYDDCTIDIDAHFEHLRKEDLNSYHCCW